MLFLLPTMDCAELSISIYIKNWWRKYRLIRNGVSGKLPVFPVGKKILAEVKRIKGIRLARHPEAFEKKDYMAATQGIGG